MDTDNQHSNNIDELLHRAQQQREEDEYEEYEDEEAYEEEEDYEDEDVLEEDTEEEDSEDNSEAEKIGKETLDPIGQDLKPFLQKYGTLDNICFMLFSLAILIMASSWNTTYATKLRSLSEREDYLKDLRYRDLFTTAELVRLGRISNIENSIKELGLTLEHSTQPPYEVIDTLTTAQDK